MKTKVIYPPLDRKRIYPPSAVWGRALPEHTQLEVRIDNATRNIEKTFRESLEKMTDLKQKINDIEAGTSKKGRTETSQHCDDLNCLMDSLDKLTDSAILRSKTAWEVYKKLHHYCGTQAFETAKLDELRALCKKTEQLAADLLCFSLAHFKKKEA